ncbi:MAG: PrgI family protein, partial [Patescibacteria group bacterium]
MRFQVPQFIEIEDKIFGPLTIKQFIYLAGGAGITIILLTFLPKFLALLIALPFIALSVALSFYKPNSRPFVVQLESMLRYFLGEKLYIWKKA